MPEIKETFAAGKFYASDKDELLKNLENYKKSHKADYTYESRAIIVPHAGYSYSGQLAFDGFCNLKKDIKNIFILAPTHRRTVDNIAVAPYDEFETPLGNLCVNKFISEEMIKNFDCEYSVDAFDKEHDIEVQLPFIKFLYGDTIKVVPVLIGNDDVEKTIKLIKHYYVNEQNAFVISSDLSHFLKDEDAKKVDMLTATMIETGHIRGFRFEQACGAIPVCALSEVVREKNFSLIRVGMTNSGVTTGDLSNVVGYGSWFVYEGERNDFIQKYFSPKLISIAKRTIHEKLLGKSEINITSYFPYPPVLDSGCATFVTLELDGKLRGCIGSSIAHTSLLVDLIKNSYNAAFMDPRFKPLTREEFDKIKISISLLSNPVAIQFSDEEDLLSKIKENVDGIIIRDNDKQALYLPSVWKQLPDKRNFLKSLKLKAGLKPDYFSKTFEAYKFKANYIR